MDDLSPLERLLRRVYNGNSSRRVLRSIRFVASELTPKQFVEHLRAEEIRALADGRHCRLQPAVERIAQRLQEEKRRVKQSS